MVAKLKWVTEVVTETIVLGYTRPTCLVCDGSAIGSPNGVTCQNRSCIEQMGDALRELEEEDARELAVFKRKVCELLSLLIAVLPSSDPKHKESEKLDECMNELRDAVGFDDIPFEDP